MLTCIRDWWGTELPDSDQTGHHICGQCNESIFVSTEDYQLEGDNKIFNVSEESSREKAYLFKSQTLELQAFTMQIEQGVLLTGNLPQDIVFLRENLMS